MTKTEKKASAQPVSDDSEMKDILERGVAEIIPKKLFEKRLKAGEKMKVYLGVDPTGPDIHIGHAIHLRKLAKLQALGHEIVLLIGDFTARIGDPTGKDTTRPVLTHEEILENAKTYKEQASKILDFDGPNAAVIEFNAKWLEKLNFQDVMELASEFTVQQMLERDMFENRTKEGRPIYVHEFFYPMMQGYDSVAMDVDMEMGGSDQLFNMLAGRTLLKSRGGKEKIVFTIELLEGLDGRKMSKSYNNIVGVMDLPNEMFGKIMAVADELIPKYFTLCTDYSFEDVAAVVQAMNDGENPRDLKVKLAREIVTLYHSASEAASAEKEFFAIFQKKEKPADMPVHTVSAAKIGLIELIVEVGFAPSTSDARRSIQQGGVRVNDEKVIDVQAEVLVENGTTLQVGKRKFVELKRR